MRTPPIKTPTRRNIPELSEEQQVEALGHEFKRSVLIDCLRKNAPQLFLFQESSVREFYTQVDVAYRPLGDRYALRLSLSQALRDHPAFQPQEVLSNARRYADRWGCLVYVSSEADQRPWTETDQEAWLKVPSLFRDAPECPGCPFWDTPQRRRERLLDWAERGQRFQEDVQAADQGKAAMLAWAQQTWANNGGKDLMMMGHHEEGVPYTLEGFLVGAGEVDLYASLLKGLPSKTLSVGVLAQSPHGAKWLLGHPHAAQLVGLMKDSEVLTWMAEAEFPTRMLGPTPFADPAYGERLLQPWLALLEPRSPAHLTAIWKAHRERFLLRAREFVRSHRPIRGVLLDEFAWERLPKVWLSGSGLSSGRFEYHDHQEKEPRMQALVETYQAADPLFRSALEALERQQKFKEKRGMRPKVRRPTPWQTWLKANAGEALWGLRGLWPDREGALVERSFRERLIEMDRYRPVYGEDNLADWFAAGGP